MSFLRISPRAAKPDAITTVFVSTGLLLDELNHDLSIKAFNVLAKAEDKEIAWDTALPQVLAADAKIKAGGKDGYTEAQFIAELRRIFALEQASNAAITTAWNAMLGDVSTLQKNITDLKTSLAKHEPALNCVLMTRSNPPHVKALICGKLTVAEDQTPQELPTANPIRLADEAVYVSFLQQAAEMTVRMRDTNLCEEMLAQQSLQPQQVLLINPLLSLNKHPGLKKMEENAAANRKKWAESNGWHACDFKKGQQSVAEAVFAYLKSRELQQNLGSSSAVAAPADEKEVELSNSARLGQ